MVGPEVTPEMRAVMDETMVMMRAGKMLPEPVPWFWEGRREEESVTAEYLGRVLDELPAPELAERARLGHFDDYSAPEEVADGLEPVRLVVELRRRKQAVRRLGEARGEAPATIAEAVARYDAVENAVRRGEFDATKAESDRWAASKSGQDAVGELVRGAAAATPLGGPGVQTVGRNAPCPCGSGLKYKRCHGA